MKSTTQATSMHIEEPIRIGFATTPEEKREVYRFRYTVFAEETAYNLTQADQQNNLLFDDWDNWGILLSAKMDSTIIGTARINIGKITDFHPCVIQEYHMDKFRKFYSEEDSPYLGIISRFVIHPQYRSTSACWLLMTNLTKLLFYEYQLHFVFGSCNFHLISMYEHFGFRRIDKNTTYPKTGTVSSLVLVNDLQHLQRVRSPLLRSLRKGTLNDKVVAWFNSEFSNKIKSTINTRLITGDELWAIIYEYLKNIPNQIISLLQGLSILEAKLFLHFCSTIVHCNPGDSITADGSISQETIVLLSGLATSSLEDTILPGQSCGNNGLVHRTVHSSTVVAETDVNILVFSLYSFISFKKRHPKIAAKIINTLQQ